MTGGKKKTIASGKMPLIRQTSEREMEEFKKTLRERRTIMEADREKTFTLNPLAALIAKLETASKSNVPRVAVRNALAGVVDFMRYQPKLFRRQDWGGLNILLLALHELNDGVVSPLLKPEKRSPRRQSDPIVPRVIKAISACAMGALMTHAGMKRMDAARAVATVLRKHGFPMGRGHKEDAEARTVAQWRFNVGATNRWPSGSRLHQMFSVPPSLSSKPPTVIRDKILRLFNENLANIWTQDPMQDESDKLPELFLDKPPT
ncbi:MAG: hypothetical protein ABL951_14660 [Alphaproteobacteria bacterium]